MLLKEIRSRTAHNHTRLEQSPLLLSFSTQRIDLEIYLSILRKFYGYFYPLEQILNSFTELAQWLPDYTVRRKARLLLDDLHALPGSPEVSLCDNLPSIHTTAQAYGCLYVLEGSTLGGKLIFNILKKQLDLDETKGASFFYGYGKETGLRWQVFSQSLESFSQAHQADEEIIEAANETFLKLEQWMQKQN